MRGSLCAAVRVSKPGASTRGLPGDRNSPCGLPALHRVCRKPSQNRRTLPPLPANRTAGALGEERARAATRGLPKDAQRPEKRFFMKTTGRRQSLIFPREHGAWGILLVPLVTGASVGLLAGGRAWPLV